MRRLLPLFLLALAPAAASAQERPSKAVPVLGKAPKVDGNLKDFGGGAPLKSSASEATASFTGKVGWRKDTLYLALEAKDDVVTEQDGFTVTLFFPGAGPTATGHTWRLGPEGLKPVASGDLTPEFAQERAEAGAQEGGGKLALEVALPARAFPRIPAKEPLVFDLCVTYEDKDPEGGAVPVSNCSGGSMLGAALKLPDDFRKGLKLKVPESVRALEAAPKGWLGWGVLHLPDWLEADEPLMPSLLREMVASDVVDPAKVGVEVAEALSLPDGRTLLPVVFGKNPYAVAGQCDGEKELRLGIFLVERRTARQVLEWPAANCALGRAQAVVLDEEGALTIRYSNGATVNFAWSGDHFARTELGNR